MRVLLRLLSVWAALALMVSAVCCAQSASDLPHLEQRGRATQLIVDGKPMLLLGGELHNSSSSSVAYMEPVWPRLAAMHLNTVLAPVAWETIEAKEGTYDFSVVNGLLDGARRNHLRLVVLWFGAWKNTFSSYAPGWVKRDEKRFPRVESSGGRGTERLSPFSANVLDADAKAFRALMRHLRAVDGTAHTVLMVQVENEVGVIPESRDHSAVAEAAFHGQVPAALTAYMAAHRAVLNPELRAAWEAAGGRLTGTWQVVFGTGTLTDDLFMAWHYATYIERVTAAGKAEYALPMYVNAALIRPNYEPGQYNSGGPLPHSIDIYHAGAPSLAMLSPDIYFNEFALWSSSYTRRDNALFIPEAQGGATGAANLLYAFGHLDAIGFAAFGIDDVGNTPLDLVGITNAAEHPDSNALSYAYAEIAALSDQLLAAQQSGHVYAGLLEGEAQRASRIPAGGFIANVTRAGSGGARVGVMLMETAPEEYLVVGSGDAQVSFTADTPGPPTVGIESIDEVFCTAAGCVTGRRLNGDESSQGQALRLSAGDAALGREYRVRLYRYR